MICHCTMIYGTDIYPANSAGCPRSPQLGTFRGKGVCALSDRNSIYCLASVYESQTKDKRPRRSNVNAVNLLQKRGIHVYSSLEEAFEFCCSFFAEELNTKLHYNR